MNERYCNPWLESGEHWAEVQYSWLEEKFSKLAEYVSWKYEVPLVDVFKTLIAANDYYSYRHSFTKDDMHVFFLKNVLWRTYGRGNKRYMSDLKIKGEKL